MRFRLRMGILVLSLWLPAGGCARQKEDSAAAVTSARPMVLGGPANIAMLPLIAEELGYFRDEGVDVKYRPLQTGKITQDALVSGDLDVGVLVDTNIAFIRFRGGDDIRVLCTIEEKVDDAIIARQDRGIKTVADLAGKKVGYLPATTSHVFLARLLQKNGVEIGKLNLVSMTPPAMQAAVVRGDVDAISVWQPFRYNSLKALDGVGITLSDRSAYLSYALLAVRDSQTKGRSADLAKMLKALIRAEEFVKADPSRAKEILSRAIPFEREALDQAWDEYVLRVRFDPGLKELIENEARWIKATQDGFRDLPMPDYRENFDPSLLRSISNERVSLAP